MRTLVVLVALVMNVGVIVLAEAFYMEPWAIVLLATAAGVATSRLKAWDAEKEKAT